MSPITQSQHPGYDTEGTLTLGTKTCGYVGADMWLLGMCMWKRLTYILCYGAL